MKNHYANLLDMHVQSNANLLGQDEEYYYLYKHFTLDIEKKTLGIFYNNNLRYTHPSDFNDPYDCHCSIEFDFTDFKKQSVEDFANIKIKPSTWIQQKNQIKASLKEDFSASSYIEGLRKFFRITCFNNAPLSILMWSHYANHHKGFMLEFRFKKEDGLEPLPLPIFYQDELPKQLVPWDMINFTDNNEIMTESIIKQLLTKSSEWSYEKEFRLISDTGEFKEFLPSSLASVIFGSKMSEEDQETIKTAIKDFNHKNSQNVCVYQASVLPNKFKLHVEEHPRLSI